MLGRKDYTREELDHAEAAVVEQFAAWKKIKKVSDREVEAVYFNNMAIVLDRLFVHRIRAISGKDGNPLNELELIVESLMNNGAVFQGNNVIKYVPDASVVKLAVGDTIKLGASDFERLSQAFFAELERRFL